MSHRVFIIVYNVCNHVTQKQMPASRVCVCVCACDWFLNLLTEKEARVMRSVMLVESVYLVSTDRYMVVFEM